MVLPGVVFDLGRIEHRERRTVIRGKHATVAIDGDGATTLGPRARQPFIVVAVFGRAIEAGGSEGEARPVAARCGIHIENDDPQPQVVFAFGLRMTNCAPASDSV